MDANANIDCEPGQLIKFFHVPNALHSRPVLNSSRKQIKNKIFVFIKRSRNRIWLGNSSAIWFFT